MHVELKGLGEFDRDVASWFQAVEAAAGDVAKGLAHRVFENALKNSPQFSGDYTASWRVSIGSVDFSYSKDAVAGAARWGEGFASGQIFGRGDEPAMSLARATAAAVWGQKIELGQSIYVSNSATHAEPYAWKIENGSINFRTPNMGADGVGRKAVARIGRAFATIDKSKFDILRRVGV